MQSHPPTRIAISGTHRIGKSTLIEEFLRGHPEFFHEPEPYEVLVEDYGEEFSAQPTADDYYRQLKFNIERLHRHQVGEKVIYERCPVDFLAYILALRDLKTEVVDVSFVDRVVEMVLDAIQHLDLIVFLPLEEADNNESVKLRSAANSQFVDLLVNDEFGIVRSGLVDIIGASGTTTERLRILETEIAFF